MRLYDFGIEGWRYSTRLCVSTFSTYCRVYYRVLPVLQCRAVMLCWLYAWLIVFFMTLWPRVIVLHQKKRKRIRFIFGVFYISAKRISFGSAVCWTSVLFCYRQSFNRWLPVIFVFNSFFLTLLLLVALWLGDEPYYEQRHALISSRFTEMLFTIN